MRPQTYDSTKIESYLEKQQYATLDELKDIVGTSVSMTIFRKLKELSYISSCSHRGKYYSLERIAQYDTQGLWRPNGILFSKFGTLLDTVEYFVCNSKAGYTSSELRDVLFLEVKESLMHLWVETRISREVFDDVFLYTSDEKTRKRQQLLIRKQRSSLDISRSSVDDQIKAAIIIFYSILDEKQRRLYAGLESIKQGRKGGDTIIARLLGINIHTVAKGRRELLQSNSRDGVALIALLSSDIFPTHATETKNNYYRRKSPCDVPGA